MRHLLPVQPNFLRQLMGERKGQGLPMNNILWPEILQVMWVQWFKIPTDLEFNPREYFKKYQPIANACQISHAVLNLLLPVCANNAYNKIFSNVHVHCMFLICSCVFIGTEYEEFDILYFTNFQFIHSFIVKCAI